MGGWGRYAGQGNGGGEEGDECDGGEGQRPLPSGAAIAAGGWGRSGGQATTRHLALGGAATPGPASV